jgi:hypothetical protein
MSVAIEDLPFQHAALYILFNLTGQALKGNDWPQVISIRTPPSRGTNDRPCSRRHCLASFL